MGVPQLILLSLYAMCLGIELCDLLNGKLSPKKFTYSVISLAIQIGLQAWGGFYR